MVKSGDVNGIIDAINKIEEMNSEEREQMGQNGRNAVLNHFTYRRLAEKFAKAFEEK